MQADVDVLRTRLEYSHGDVRDSELISGLVALGEAARELMPLVTKRFEEQKLVLSEIDAVALFEVTSNDAFLDKYFERKDSKRLSIGSKCRLLAAGRRDVEKHLRTDLADKWREYATSGASDGCCDAAITLGMHGSSSVRPLLDLIQSQLMAAIDEAREAAGDSARDTDWQLSETGIAIALKLAYANELLNAVNKGLAATEARDGFEWDASNLAGHQAERKKRGQKSMPWCERQVLVNLLKGWREYAAAETSAGRKPSVRKFCEHVSGSDWKKVQTDLDSQRKWEKSLVDDYRGQKLGAITVEKFAELKSPGMSVADLRQIIGATDQPRQ